MPNKKLIKQYSAMYKQIQNITPSVYAGIALALHRKYKWEYKRINELFMESQVIWNECVQSDVNMLQMCSDETGIDVRGL